MNPNSAGRGFPVDQNLPRWACQKCRHPLWIVGADAVPDKFLSTDASSRSGMHGSSILGSGSVLGASKMDHSFVVLPKQRSPSYGIPPRPRNALSQADTNLSGKPMEESYVVLPPAAASMYKCESGSDVYGTQQSIPSGNHNNTSPASGSGFHSSVTVLNRAFEIATTQTQVDQPLCLECMKILSDKLEKEVEEVNIDIKVYEASLRRFESESHNILSEAEFRKEKLKAEEEEKRLEAAIQEAEKQCAAVDAELMELDLKSKNFNELQERYWHEFNSFQFQLTAHQEERDAILAKIEVSQAHLELLKYANVVNDAFPITHEGVFGTINNFRFGRIPKIPVEWDEVNAAWGQACLLLHTMCQYFRPKFPYRIKILPMGSYPRIMDTNNNTYELFGPVNLFWSTRYDKAMILFLQCLKDFGDFARSKDRELNLPPEKCFQFKLPIENGTIGKYTITQSFNKQETWTNAMKCMLCNLKWALYWFVGNTNFHPLCAPPTEASPVNSLHSKHNPISKISSKP